MILDIITAALIVVPMGIGMAKGFLYIAVRLLGWVGALAAGFICAPAVRDLLAASPIGDNIHESLTARFAEGTEGVDAAGDGLPSIMGDLIGQAVQDTAEMMVSGIETVILSVLGFVITAVLARLVLILVIRPLSKRINDSPASFLNKLAGLAAGGIEGLLLAFLFLAALIPLMHMTSPETSAAIADGLKYSYLAGTLYDGNMLLAIFGQII